MKKVLLLLLVAIAAGCSKDVKFEANTPESFAFKLDKSWELNSSIRIKGFTQKELENDSLAVDISYEVDLITSEKDTIEKADFGKIERLLDEEVTDLGLDIQIELDDYFNKGKYEIVYFIEDNYSKKKDTLKTIVELTE